MRLIMNHQSKVEDIDAAILIQIATVTRTFSLDAVKHNLDIITVYPSVTV